MKIKIQISIIFGIKIYSRYKFLFKVVMINTIRETLKVLEKTKKKKKRSLIAFESEFGDAAADDAEKHGYKKKRNQRSVSPPKF